MPGAEGLILGRSPAILYLEERQQNFASSACGRCGTAGPAAEEDNEHTCGSLCALDLGIQGCLGPVLVSLQGTLTGSQVAWSGIKSRGRGLVISHRG